MDQIDTHTLMKFLNLDDDNPKMTLDKAKVAISAARSANKSASMSDAECIAYSQAIYLTEIQRKISENKLSKVDQNLRVKYKYWHNGLPQCITNDPEYKKSTKSLEDSQKNSINLFKQALMRNPSDEQLRMLCAGSIYSKTGIQKSSCIKILEDSEIAKDTVLSIRIMNAAIQWEKSISDIFGESDDFEMVMAFITKNFSNEVMLASMPNDNSDTSKHPSYERGAYLLKKCNQMIVDSGSYTEIADEAMRCMDNINNKVLKQAFENYPNFASVYANFIHCYKDAYTRVAINKLNLSSTYKTYESVTSKPNGRDDGGR